MVSHSQHRQTLIILVLSLALMCMIALIAKAAAPEAPAPPAPLSIQARSQVLEILLQYSLAFQKRENLYVKTIKPLDDDLAKINETLSSALKPYEREGYVLDVGSCLTSDEAARKGCLSYVKKPDEAKPAAAASAATPAPAKPPEKK